MSTVLCVLTILAAPAVEDVPSPDVPLPIQPFTVDLLDLMRGQWHFDDPLGQHLSLPRAVTAFAYPGQVSDDLRLGWLLCDPEFPEDLEHAILRIVAPSDGDGSFEIDEPFFSAKVTVEWTGDVACCSLSDIGLGPATTGDRYVSALYLLVDGQPSALWLTPSPGATRLEPRLFTDRVGGVFVDDEPVRVTLTSEQGAREPFTLSAFRYDTGEEAYVQTVHVDGTLRPAMVSVEVPLEHYGVFRLVARAEDGSEAALRVCRIPEPIAIDPDRSRIGINLFQQQIWWYAYQAPMMARAGVHWIRPWLAWENAWSTQEPEPGKWDPSALDTALRRMEGLDQRYQAMLWSAPDWLTGGTVFGVPPLSALDEWAAYVTRLVTRYRDRIDLWEVWNEPDLMWPEESRHDGEHYLAMLQASYVAAKEADPDCTVLGLSHAGYEEWLRNVGALGAGRWFDVATIHTYAPPRSFPDAVKRRRQLLADGGMGEKPVWVNEFGSVAYDESEGYSRQYQCSERQQAERLTALYASALAVGPGAKAFWFCTYDPRDAAHEDQWTGDAGIGVLYLGFVPKLSYAALAGVAHQLDGREALGSVKLTPTRTQIAFEGGVSVVWDEREGRGGSVLATDLGCLPEEAVTVRDLYTNELARGAAEEVVVDLTRGPVYVEGSSQMGAIARCEAAFEVSTDALSVPPGTETLVTMEVPAGVSVEVAASPGLPVSWVIEADTLRLRAPEDAGRVSGAVAMRVTFPAGIFGLLAPHVAQRSIPVTTGAPNLVRDGGFDLGDVGEWTPERMSAYAWDSQVGCAAAGSLRLDGPFDRRLVHWNVEPAAGKDWHFSAKVRTEDLSGCLATVSLAFFSREGWLGSWCLARTDVEGNSQDWPTVDSPGHIPLGTSDWTPVEATLRADLVPPGTERVALFIDVSGGSGVLWFDDLDLYQP